MKSKEKHNMKKKELDTIVIIDGKPMWKKDWEKQEKENENTQEYYCAVVLPSGRDWTGRHRRDEIVYIVKVKWNTKHTKYTFLPKSTVIGERDFTDLEILHGERIVNGMIYRKPFCFVTGDLDGDEIVDKILYVNDDNFIDIYKTFEKVNALETAIKYEVVEELYAQCFQEEKSSKERNEWLDEQGANDDGVWADYVEEDIQDYIDKLNKNLEKTKKTKKRKSIKVYKLVEL